jgi:tRNA (guanine37-N1)-methyltransferase
VRVDLVSIFPDYFGPLELSLTGRARQAGLLDVAVHDLRRWAHDRHRTVDDTPYGGGAGMVMKPEPWGEALDTVAPPGAAAPPRLLVMTPSGRRFDQRLAEELAAEPWLLFACGRYEGIDQRVVEAAAERMPVDEISIGDYVLGGGEVAALVVIEAVVRLLPGFVGNPASLVEESHATGAGGGLLEYPVYTKPPVWRGRGVPDVLLSGHHGRVARWRRDQALLRTARRRPDLIAAQDPAVWDQRDRQVLGESGFDPGEAGPDAG